MKKPQQRYVGRPAFSAIVTGVLAMIWTLASCSSGSPQAVVSRSSAAFHDTRDLSAASDVIITGQLEEYHGLDPEVGVPGVQDLQYASYSFAISEVLALNPGKSTLQNEFVPGYVTQVSFLVQADDQAAGGAASSDEDFPTLSELPATGKDIVLYLATDVEVNATNGTTVMGFGSIDRGNVTFSGAVSGSIASSQVTLEQARTDAQDYVGEIWVANHASTTTVGSVPQSTSDSGSTEPTVAPD